MSKILCDASDLHLVYQVLTHRPRNARDTFISLCRNPIGFWTRQHDRKHVLRGIDFQIREGDRIAILGVNGAGKSSLCRMLSTVVIPTKGRLQHFGRARAIFQSPLMLYPELTGYENAELLASLLYPRLAREKMRDALDEACEFAELGDSLYMPFRTYSTGMQTRLMLSMVTSQPADLLILDEVFDGADIFWQKKIASRMEKLIDASGGLVFVSHNPQLVTKICNRVWILHQGHLQIFTDPVEGMQSYLASQGKTNSDETEIVVE